ncbi:MAG TPA: hypothetical protein VNA17_07640 [Pyrinomonadaceae bacterium]|nr:hypothetical protein [Pyrinomonadaceae bacterium]
MVKDVGILIYAEREQVDLFHVGDAGRKNISGLFYIQHHVGRNIVLGEVLCRRDFTFSITFSLPGKGHPLQGCGIHFRLDSFGVIGDRYIVVTGVAGYTKKLYARPAAFGVSIV